MTKAIRVVFLAVVALIATTGCGEDAVGSVDDPVAVRDVVVDVDGVSATIQWSTDEPVTGFVTYRGPDGVESRGPTGGLGLQHEATLSDLSPDTEYEFDVTATRDTGGETTVAGGEFVTRTPGEGAPVILAATANVTGQAAAISVQANESVTVEVRYGLDDRVDQTAGSSALGTTAIVPLPSLLADSAYTWRVVVTDTRGNTAESAVETFNTAAEEVEEVVEISIVASQWEFTPDTLRVPLGAKVRLTLTSADVPHGFGLNAYRIDKPINPGDPTVIEFTADEEGEFPFICTINCGAGHGTMTGTLIVE